MAKRGQRVHAERFRELDCLVRVNRGLLVEVPFRFKGVVFSLYGQEIPHVLFLNTLLDKPKWPRLLGVLPGFSWF